mmetsp:Transcript_12730/g.16130  ORF Transcript_12730/g.16130 Transcript_12730/m.16130 type:complete len:777 (-) Transcript_12730:154-2484(-)
MSPIEKYQRLSKLLSVNARASLPHPSWKPIHDAILVSAIAKHGWIDKESHIGAIIGDEDIQWGKPFDKGDLVLPSTTDTNKSSTSSSSDVENDKLEEVALRAVDFLNEQTDCKDLKGFNLNLVLKSYGIVSRTVVDEDGQAETDWHLDPDSKPTIIDGSTPSSISDDESYQELPTRKDLLKRAKIVLSKCPESVVSSSNAGNNKETDTHQFYVLDQSKISNVFLAELLRATFKQNQKTIKMARKLLSSALQETQHRMRSMTSASERAEFSRLRGHIALLDRAVKTKQINRPVKNVLRAILGMPILPPANPKDETFISDNYSFSAINGELCSVRGKYGKKKSNESAIGDLAISNAVFVAKQRAENVSKESEVTTMLGITTIETLILSVMCSQGIPIYTDDWEQALGNDDDEEINECSYLISWFHMGHVLEVAAEKWVEISQANLAKTTQGDKTGLENELESRQAAHKEAMRLHQKPIYLAKKTIMLMEAIRLQMGPESKYSSKNGIRPDKGIGQKVLHWNRGHLIKWAKALNVYSLSEGHIMHATVMSIRPHSTAEGFLDKKNCKSIFSQISQQTRLRSLFSKYTGDELHNMVFKSVKIVRKSGDIWDDQPYWWREAESETDSKDDFDLLSGILRFGYGGFDQMLEGNEHFRSSMASGESIGRLYRSSGQQRANSITRELSGIDDSAETMRIMKERKKRMSQSKEPTRVNTGNSIQVGIGAFFSAKNSPSPTSNGNKSDDSEVAIVAVVSPKRSTCMEQEDNSKSSPKRRKVEEATI